MNSHVIRASARNVGQCQCLWCARRAYFGECPVTDAIKDALAAFVREHGRAWRSKLWNAWQSGATIDPALQEFRAMGGMTRYTLQWIKTETVLARSRSRRRRRVPAKK